MQTTKILIVEDEALIAEEIRDCLEHLGHTVTGIVDTADAVLAAVRDQAPELVLMDIRLKGGADGVDAAWLIGERANVPVVFMTAHSDPATLDRALLTRPFGYVVKPVREVDLATAVQTALIRAAAERRLRVRADQAREVVDRSTDYIVRVSPEGRVMEANLACRTALGFTPPQLARMWLAELVAEADREPLYSRVFQRNGDPGAACRVALVTRSGRTVPVNAIATRQFCTEDGSDWWIVFEPVDKLLFSLD
jgi:PAS domain S-box-containing protein